ncbi:hypothetical protein IEQ34_014212 [Dendrobium chrysotoxum]|uniref:Ku70/Ku80 N-terminal alpha/beta domain-containing protein n=1 Tax=Dendrobium chrysotoxum TaxID=161865 RepID=A0AAV7GKM1_DENCH|nr:hypothetical protein IEQ34_014212 [Dendrobium chrysotoxum]
MARNKEALVLVVDVGPTMHDSLPDIEKLFTMLVQKKLMYSKNDEVGIVLFGTEGAIPFPFSNPLLFFNEKCILFYS